MGNLQQLSQGITNIFNRPQPVHVQPVQHPTGVPPMPQAPGGMQPQAVVNYPPAPALKHQSKPTEMSMSDLKYNAFNVDQIKLNITPRSGFDGVTPDMVIWNRYQYNVTELKANAEENELSAYVSWALQEKGIQDVKIDFHPGQKVSLSGKYPILGIPLPFKAEVQLSLNEQKQILMTVQDFSTGFTFPNKMRDTLIDLLVSDSPASQGPPPMSPLEAFSFSAALRQVGPNQILLDFSQMPVPMNLPVTGLETTEQGIQLTGGK